MYAPLQLYSRLLSRLHVLDCILKVSSLVVGEHYSHTSMYYHLLMEGNVLLGADYIAYMQFSS